MFFNNSWEKPDLVFFVYLSNLSFIFSVQNMNMDNMNITVLWRVSPVFEVPDLSSWLFCVVSCICVVFFGFLTLFSAVSTTLHLFGCFVHWMNQFLFEGVVGFEFTGMLFGFIDTPNSHVFVLVVLFFFGSVDLPTAWFGYLQVRKVFFVCLFLLLFSCHCRDIFSPMVWALVLSPLLGWSLKNNKTGLC